MKFSFYLILVFLTYSSFCQTPKSKPNIIFILADDLGYGELGVYGQRYIETPNIDQLAKSGMLFTQHYSGSAVCAPSRSVLLTGKHTGHTYIRGNDEMASRGPVWDFEAMLADSSLEGQRPLPQNTPLLPKVLKNAGYTTAVVGKWGLGYPGSESTPNKMGFDYFYGYNCQRQAHGYYPTHLYENEHRVYLSNKFQKPNERLDSKLNSLDETSYEKYTQNDFAPDLMFDKILDFVEENKKKPFFLYWATPIPHVSLQASQSWVKHYVKKFGDEEPYLGDKGYLPSRYPKATYAAMVSYLDEQIGELISKLKQDGIYENTLIIFTSDNGPTYGGGANSTWFESAGPFKSNSGWGKGSLHEGGIRVPMIAAWPNHIKAGSVSNHISAFYDVMPTLSQIAQTVSPPTDGISFVPTLLGEKQQEHPYLYWEFTENTGSIAVRKGKWKGLIPDAMKGNTEMQLFDLYHDPQEQFNLASSNPKIIEELNEIIKKEHQKSEIERFWFPFDK